MSQSERDVSSAGASEIQRAIAGLRAGRVIAIPTDTVYGLAAALDQPEAIEQLFEIKGRETTKAIPVLVDSLECLNHLGGIERQLALALAGAFWPGPLTLVVTSPDRIPEEVHRGAETVGLRMPAHPVARALIAGAGGALAVTSANRSGMPEAVTAGEVRKALGEAVSLVVDGGRTPGGRPSTVVDLTSGRVRILRHGMISLADFERTIHGAGIEE